MAQCLPKTNRVHNEVYEMSDVTSARMIWAPFLAGAAGGMVAAIFTSPLDVVKTRFQSDFYQNQLAAIRAARCLPAPESLPFPRSSFRHFRETIHIISSVKRIEGWRGLFKGLGPNLLGVMPASAIKFYAYENSKRIISGSLNEGRDKAWVHALAAAIAGVTTCTATNPIWLVKTRLQLDKSSLEKKGYTGGRRYKNSFDCIVQILRQEGFGGLYRGLAASYLGVAESTLHWVLYERLKLQLKRRKERRSIDGVTSPNDDLLDWGGRTMAAGATKLFVALIAYPHEVVRTRLRQAPENGGSKYTGLLQCFRLIWKEEGLVSLYGGLTPHLLRVVPSTAIIFGVYELAMRLLDFNK